MTEHQQADALFTGTDAGFSGSGSASPAAVDGGSDYTAWQWEVVLAMVFGLAIPGRAEVTARPWLTIGQNGQGGTGLHLIWSASWDTKPNSGGTSVQAYLNPDVYTAGGAWDLFLNAPAGPLSASAGQNYTGLPLDPRTFLTAASSVADVTAMLAAAAQRFADLRGQATADDLGFQGNLADVVAQLLGELGTITQSLHDQMSEPGSYSQSIGAAGDAGTAFATSLQSAYNDWLAVPGHSPLGAIVQVLVRIATKDSTGAYVIADPQHTIYGDLTTVAAWTAVEQAAKNLWSGAITGDSDFAGLDPLARAALSNLVSQYEATTSVIVPVLGPARPRPKPRPVGGGTGSGRTGSAKPPAAVTPGPGSGAVNGPGGGHNFAANAAASPATGSSPDSGPPVGGPEPVAVAFPGIVALGVGAFAWPNASGAVGRQFGDGVNGTVLARGDDPPEPPVAVGVFPGVGTDGVGARSPATALSWPIGAHNVRPQPDPPPVVTSEAGVPIGVIGRVEVKQPVSPPAVTPAARTDKEARSWPLNTHLVPATASGSPVVAGPIAGPGGEAGGPGGPLVGQVGQRDQERQRLAYLPQDEEYWDTDTSGVVAPIGMRDVSDPPEQDFESSPALARIDAGNGPRTSSQIRPDRRNP